jgi:hypothetical protein
MPDTRKDLVQRLVGFSAPLAPTLAALREFGWDCDTPLVTLDATSLVSVLERYLAGTFTAADVEAWADAVECRDDIDDTPVHDVVFELANPEITARLSPSRARDLLRQFGRHEGYQSDAANAGKRPRG